MGVFPQILIQVNLQFVQGGVEFFTEGIPTATTKATVLSD